MCCLWLGVEFDAGLNGVFSSVFIRTCSDSWRVHRLGLRSRRWLRAVARCCSGQSRVKVDGQTCAGRRLVFASRMRAQARCTARVSRTRSTSSDGRQVWSAAARGACSALVRRCTPIGGLRRRRAAVVRQRLAPGRGASAGPSWRTARRRGRVHCRQGAGIWFAICRTGFGRKLRPVGASRRARRGELAQFQAGLSPPEVSRRPRPAAHPA